MQKGVGRALQKAQQGAKPASAKPLTGFGGASVLEIRDNYDSDTFRAVYTVRFAERLYVLHVFQKKSRQGIQTAKHDIVGLSLMLASKIFISANFEQQRPKIPEYLRVKRKSYIEVIRDRLRAAETLHQEWLSDQREEH